MSDSDHNPEDFFDEVVATGYLYSFMNDEGIPLGTEREKGTRVMPFWSSQHGAEQMIALFPGDHSYKPIRIALPEFEHNWLPGIERDGLLIGINWINRPAESIDLDRQQFLEFLDRAR